jgi:hypothetical protein
MVQALDRRPCDQRVLVRRTGGGELGAGRAQTFAGVGQGLGRAAPGPGLRPYVDAGQAAAEPHHPAVGVGLGVQVRCRLMPGTGPPPHDDRTHRPDDQQQRHQHGDLHGLLQRFDVCVLV